MLTRKQYELLMFIRERVRESGVPPSFDEMKDALNLKSKSGIHRLITALEERGFLRRIEKRARAMEIVKLPENVSDTLRPASTRAKAQRLAPIPDRRPKPSCGMIDVPMVGRLAAGTPIEALQNKLCDFPVQTGMLGRGDHYALEVTGDSMINAGILDGDTIIVCETDTAQTGEIVVALIDEREATLKRLRRRGDHIALEASNPCYETRLYAADRVRIQGKLVGLVRHY